MTIRLTEDQWADFLREPQVPPRVSDPTESQTYVLISSESYERFKALFEADPATQQEREAQLQEFGKRAGWDDPAMNIYDDLDPR